MSLTEDNLTNGPSSETILELHSLQEPEAASRQRECDGRNYRNENRRNDSVPMTIVRHNGALVVGKTIDVSKTGIGLAHYGSIGKRGDEITLTMNSGVEYTYQVEIVWSQEVLNQNGLYRSGVKIIKKTSQFSKPESSVVDAGRPPFEKSAKDYPIPSEEDVQSLETSFSLDANENFDEDRRGSDRISLYSSASILCSNGATVLGRARNMSRHGIGLMHSGSIGNIGDSIVVTMNSGTEQYQYVYTIQWQTKLADSPFWISGSSFTTRLEDDSEDPRKYLHTAPKAAGEERKPSSNTAKSFQRIRATIQKVIGQFAENGHDFIGEINGDTITMDTDLNIAIRMDEKLPIDFQYQGDPNYWTGFVAMNRIEIMGQTRMRITGVLSNVKISH